MSSKKKAEGKVTGGEERKQKENVEKRRRYKTRRVKTRRGGERGRKRKVKGGLEWEGV